MLPGGDRGQSRNPALIARTRRQHFDGRFRRRLFQPEPSAQPSLRHDQDRALVREGSGLIAPTASRSSARSLGSDPTLPPPPKAWKPSTKSTGCASKAATRSRVFSSARQRRLATGKKLSERSNKVCDCGDTRILRRVARTEASDLEFCQQIVRHCRCAKPAW